MQAGGMLVAMRCSGGVKLYPTGDSCNGDYNGTSTPFLTLRRDPWAAVSVTSGYLGYRLPLVIWGVSYHWLPGVVMSQQGG